MARATTVVVFGWGDGDLVGAACGVAPESARIVLVVLDPGTFRRSLGHRDYARVLLDPRLKILTGDLRSVAASMPAVDESLVVLTDEPYLAGADPALAPLTAMARELWATQTSRRAQLTTVLDNIERNLDRILASACVDDLRPALAGRPALLVAPGPSLDSQLTLLAGRSRLPPLVALDTALRPLAAAGIRPDLAVTLDPTPANVAKFDGIELECPLVFFGGARPEALAKAAQTVFACEAEGVLDKAAPWLSRGGRYRSNGSVLLAAFDVLLAVGCEPIVLVGADLAHTGGRAHATEAASNANRGTRRVRRRGGGTVETSESLWRHARRLQRRLRELPVGRVLDATADGAALEVVERVDLALWLDAASDTGNVPMALPPATAAPPEVRDAVCRALAAARR